jgi:hypothetical protein
MGKTSTSARRRVKAKTLRPPLRLMQSPTITSFITDKIRSSRVSLAANDSLSALKAARNSTANSSPAGTLRRRNDAPSASAIVRTERQKRTGDKRMPNGV